MDFTYDDEQLALQEVARSALERECGPDVVRQLAEEPDGITPALWSTLVDLGWTGLLVPEEYGGSGAGLLEMCIVLEQMGRIPLPGPFFSSAVAATLAARALGATELLADLAAGTRRGTVALGEQGHGEPARDGADAGPPQGGPVGRQRREAGRGRRAHGGLGHRGGAQRGGGALVPARVARAATLGPVARPHPQAGPARARRHTGRPAGPVGQPAGPVAARAGRHRRRAGGRDRRRGRPGPDRGHRLHVGADRLRQAGRHVPDGAPPPGRDVPAGRDGAGRLPVRRLGLGHRGARAGPGRGHGLQLRGRRRRAGDRGRHPAARRRRVHLGQRRPLPLQAGEAERAPRRRRRQPSATGWPRCSSSRHDHASSCAPMPADAGRALPGRGRLGRPHARGVPARLPPRGPDAGASGSGRRPTPTSGPSATSTRSRSAWRAGCARSGSGRATSWPSSCPTGSRRPSPSTPAPCSA